MATIDDLNVPARTRGEEAFARTLLDKFSYGDQTFKGTVTNVSAGGRVMLVIDGYAREARLYSTVKNVREGDTVDAIKKGGTWYVVANGTWHEPPAVSGSMGSPPPNATTVSGSNIPSLPFPPEPPHNPPSGNTNNQIYAWAERVATYLTNIYGWDIANRTRTIEAINRVNSIQSALNTNASRTNAVRDYAGNAGQLVEPVVDALRDERIVQ